MNKQVKVKICGIRDVNTALAAITYGADALGFVFAPGSRRISPAAAKEIIQQLPPFVSKVGVFVNAPLHEVIGIVKYCGLDFAQLHGNESSQYALQLRLPVIKAFAVKNADVLREALAYPAQAVLLDSYAANLAGGTGRCFNWKLLQGVNFNKPLILAGGLNQDNVMAAVQQVKPFAVDISSGVETAGLKDINKIALFMSRVKQGYN